ncbi:MAG: SpoIIE family protein phosphatase [bacterium]|nr:SpoIIE family protein phosphatase [Candidatus Kapabacteria bacterium]
MLNGLDDVDAIYANVMLSLMGKLGLGRAAIAEPTDDGRFCVRQAKGPAISLVGLGLSMSERTGATVVRVAELSEAGLRDTLTSGRIDSVMEVAFGAEPLMLVLLGRPLSGRDLGQDEVNYALLIGAIAAAALDGCRVRSSLRTVNRQLERQVHRLSSLFEAGRAFNTLLDRNSILRLLGYTLMGEMAIARFAVALGGANGYRMVLNRFSGEPASASLAYLAGEPSLIISQPDGDSAVLSDLHERGIRASIPMEVQGEVRGVLLVGAPLQRDIDAEDIEYLSSLANLAVTSLENARLLDEMIEKKRMEEDLRIAAQIQRGLLPETLPTIEGYEIAARTIPSQQVGGDCYDAIDLGDGRVLVSIADVSGKGTPASLLMANVQAALRTLASIDLPLTDLVSRINNVIYQNTAVDKFITAFFGILDSRTGEFTYVNAGHNHPYLFSASGIKSLDRGGLILGVMPTTLPYEQGAARLEKGDLLVLYTDGVSECLDPDRQEYGDERLQSLFTSDRDISASDAIERTRADLLRFARDAQQSDDITLLVIRRS